MHRPRIICGALALAALAWLTPALAAGPDPATKTITVAQATKIDINSADLGTLGTLKGIGNSRAAAIVAGRPYKTVDELVTKKVLTKAVLDPIRKDLVATPVAAGATPTPTPTSTSTSTSTTMTTTAATAKIDINSADLAALGTLAGIGDARAAAIVAGRPYKTVDDLVTKKVLTQAVLDPIRADLVATQSAAATKPTTTTKPATTPASKTAAVNAKDEYGTEALAKAHCPADTVVWANLDSKIFHFAGTADYGKTKKGAYMCEKEALADNIRAAKDEKHP